jgi:hypothetical protein
MTFTWPRILSKLAIGFYLFSRAMRQPFRIDPWGDFSPNIFWVCSLSTGALSSQVKLTFSRVFLARHSLEFN